MSRAALSYPPLGLRADEAARFVGVGETKFREWVERGLMPKPRRLDNCVMWDSQELAVAFRALPRDGEPANDWGSAVP